MAVPGTRTRPKGRRVALLVFVGIVGLLFLSGHYREEIVTWYRLQGLGFKPAPRGAWPMWGGSPSRNLVNVWETNIPHEWDIQTGRNIKWVAKLGSQAYTSPVIAGGRIFVGTNNEGGRNPAITGDRGILMCFREADGQFLWQAVHDKLPTGRVNDWPEQGVGSTPVVEGERLYYVSNRCELVCADVQGFRDGENDGPYETEKYRDPIITAADFVWIYDMIAELGVFPHNLAASSPVISGNLVLLVTGNGVDQSHVNIPAPQAPSFIAVDKRTGRLVWKRSDPGKNIMHGQWSSPTLGFAGGRAQAIFPGGDGWLYSFEPQTGKLIWKFDCNPKNSVWIVGGRGTRNHFVAPAAFVDGRVYITVGDDPEHGEGTGHFYCIDAAGSGDVTGRRQIWHYGDREFRRSLSTAAVDRDLIYITDLSGFLACVDRETGRPYWVHDTMAATWSSPAIIDGKVFLGDEDGDVVVLKTGKVMTGSRYFSVS